MADVWFQLVVAPSFVIFTFTAFAIFLIPCVCAGQLVTSPVFSSKWYKPEYLMPSLFISQLGFSSLTPC